jgi:hypothetical protein
MSRDVYYNIAMILGSLSVFGGVWMMHRPSALIVGGLLIIVLTLLEDRRIGRS